MFWKKTVLKKEKKCLANNFRSSQAYILVVDWWDIVRHDIEVN